MWPCPDQRRGHRGGCWHPQPLPTSAPLPTPSIPGGSLALGPGCGYKARNRMPCSHRSLSPGMAQVPATVPSWGRGAYAIWTPPQAASPPQCCPIQSLLLHSPGLGPGPWVSCTPPKPPKLPALRLQCGPHGGCWAHGLRAPSGTDPGSPPSRGSVPDSSSQRPTNGFDLFTWGTLTCGLNCQRRGWGGRKVA